MEPNGVVNFQDSATYHKTYQTVKDVSFVVNVIDPNEKMIYSFTYGAGPTQRTISYNFDIEKYNVIFSSVDNSVTSSNLDSLVYAGENSKYETTLIPKEGYRLTKDTIEIKMGGILLDLDKVLDLTDETNGRVLITPINGNIEISATTNKIAHYPVSYNLENINKSTSAVNQVENIGIPSYSATFVAKEAAENEDPYLINPYLIKVIMGGVDITGSARIQNSQNNYTI
jgi:hypothetical protein